MLHAVMRRRLLALSLSLVLLLTQQLGALHLLSHVLQPAAHTAVLAQADLGNSGPAAHRADAGDALCQVCLVLATLGAATLPTLWGWLARQARVALPLSPQRPAPSRAAPAPYQARGPPRLAGLN